MIKQLNTNIGYSVGDTVTSIMSAGSDHPHIGIRYTVTRIYKSKLYCTTGFLATVKDNETGKKYVGYDSGWFRKIRRTRHQERH